MNVVVRDARSDDAEPIATAHVAAWRVAYRGLVADEILDGRAFAETRLAGWTRATGGALRPEDDPHQRLLVPEVDGVVVGFGIFGRERPPDTGPERGEIYGFYLDPETWGTGVADTLMEACTEALRSRFTEAILWVLRDNPRARRFYERTGWSCGVGDEVVVDTWSGAVMPGLPELEPPLPEVQYRIVL